MDKGKRPVSRKKNVTGGSGRAERRGEGLHMGGPVGSGSGGGFDGHEQTGQSVGQRSTGSGGKNPLIMIILAAVVLLGGGGGTLGALLGGGGTGVSDGHSLLDSYSGNFTSTSSSTDANRGVLNTEVSPAARKKRTEILGNGKDVITIMVYMCGTDLESKYGMATSDLQEMAAATLSDKINLIVYTGGCQQWKNNIVSSSTNQIYQIRDGGVEVLEKDMGSKPMTDPETLSQYIKWGKKNFPANRYDLILWDHGGGSISGYGYDQIYANNGSMTLDKINTALKDGGCTFDFVGFDACLMATLENALVVEQYADYLIASEETEPGVGWYYTDWLTRLSQDTSMDTLEIGKNIVDDFVKVCGQKTPSDQTTLSVIDLAEVHGTVPEKFTEFAQAANQLIQDKDYQVVSNARSQSKEFAKSAGGIDQVDLIDLADHMDTDENKALAKTLRSAVKYNLTSSNVGDAYGISIYFPYARTSSVNQMANTYKKIGLDNSYTKCITSFASLEVAGQSVAGGSAGELSSLFETLLGGSTGSGNSASSLGSVVVSEVLESLLQGGGLESLGLDRNSAAFLDEETLNESRKYLEDNRFDSTALVWENSGDQKVLELPEKQWDLIQTVELNVFADDGEGYIDLGLDNVFDFDDDGNLIGEYDGTWMAINDQIVAYYFISAEGTQEDYQITGRVPVMLNGEKGDMILSFTDENPNGQVAGVRLSYENGETETQARGLTELAQGDTIDFVCDYYSYDQEFQDNYYLGEQLTVDGDLSISNIRLENEECLASYRLTDIYNNHYWTPQM